MLSAAKAPWSTRTSRTSTILRTQAAITVPQSRVRFMTRHVRPDDDDDDGDDNDDDDDDDDDDGGGGDATRHSLLLLLLLL